MFAVPVEQTVNQQAATMPFTANVNIKSLISTAVSSELVSQVTEAIPFLIGTYTTLPEHLIVDDIWLADAFKPLSHYAVVVAAFTKAMVCSCLIMLNTLYYLHILLICTNICF